MYLVYRKALAVGVTAAAILGAGGTALAVSGSDTTNGKPTSSSPDQAKHGKDGKDGKHGRNGKHKLLRRLEHAQIVTKGKDGAVTHNLILGTVTAVSPTSVTVQAEDKTSKTFTVSKSTKVVERSGEKGKKPTESSIAKIAKGDHVFVAGTGTTKIAAKRIVEVKK